MISLPNLASILHDTAPGYMAEPELNVSVASSPLLLSNFMLCFIFLQWSYQGGKLYYVHIQLLPQCPSSPREWKCSGGMNHAFLNLCYSSINEKSAWHVIGTQKALEKLINRFTVDILESQLATH